MLIRQPSVGTTGCNLAYPYGLVPVTGGSARPAFGDSSLLMNSAAVGGHYLVGVGGTGHIGLSTTARICALGDTKIYRRDLNSGATRRYDLPAAIQLTKYFVLPRVVAVSSDDSWFVVSTFDGTTTTFFLVKPVAGSDQLSGEARSRFGPAERAAAAD